VQLWGWQPSAIAWQSVCQGAIWECGGFSKNAAAGLLAMHQAQS